MTSSSKLQIAERRLDDVVVLGLTGEIALDAGDLVFGKYVDRLIQQGLVKLVLDLSGVTYIDSAGVGMIAAKLKTVRERGGDLRMSRMSNRSLRLFGMLKLLIAFEHFDDQASAIKSYEWPR